VTFRACASCASARRHPWSWSKSGCLFARAAAPTNTASAASSICADRRALLSAPENHASSIARKRLFSRPLALLCHKPLARFDSRLSRMEILTFGGGVLRDDARTQPPLGNGKKVGVAGQISHHSLRWVRARDVCRSIAPSPGPTAICGHGRWPTLATIGNFNGWCGSCGCPHIRHHKGCVGEARLSAPLRPSWSGIRAANRRANDRWDEQQLDRRAEDAGRWADYRAGRP
jgi:hypothetical protein